MNHLLLLIICLACIPLVHHCAQREPVRCGKVLPGLPGTYCQKRDFDGEIYYKTAINGQHYRVYVGVKE